MNEWCLGLEECTVQWETSCHVYQVAIVKFAIFFWVSMPVGGYEGNFNHLQLQLMCIDRR